MKHYKVGIAGFFATGKRKSGGQEVKTLSLYEALSQVYGKKNVYIVDTTNWKKKPFILLKELVQMVACCDNIIMLPAQKSVQVFIPITELVNKFYKRKLFYSVIGGWLPTYLSDKPFLEKRAKKLDKIFVETISMKKALDAKGFTNIEIVPNFKNISPIKIDDIKIDTKYPLALCTFSRVMKEKGIEDIVKAVKEINENAKKCVLTLDIYGKVDRNYVSQFEKLCQSFPSYIKYRGLVNPNQSVSVIKNYFALVFPTRFFTEGVPGTIIDAYMSGVPVIAARWKNYEGVFTEGVTGWSYSFGEYNDLKNVLNRIVKSPSKFAKMKKTTLKEANKYEPKQIIQKIIRNFD